MPLRPLFVTHLYEASLADDPDFPDFIRELEQACRDLAATDEAGQAWSREQGYGGYTSYASIPDLPARGEVFAKLKAKLDVHADAFERDVGFDLGGLRMRLEDLWVNVLRPGEGHTSHIHPYNVMSGTLYVATPPGSGRLKLEDPRLPLMMSAPPRRADVAEFVQTYFYAAVAPGALLMWESWLRHEVPPNRAVEPRISLSFNYRVA
jgi:uncharacterized protein (TIGR02466 family)